MSDLASLLDLDNGPTRPTSLLGECLRDVAVARNMSDLDRLAGDYRAVGSAFAALTPADKQTVRNAWALKRTTIRTAIPVVVTAPTPVVIPAVTAPVVDTIEVALTSVAVEGARIAASLPVARIRARRVTSAADIATATRVARLAGSRLAGYDGRIVDPGQGLGTIIQFGGAIVEYDPVADRNRQKLVAWSDVESVRVRLALPVGSFGRAPGLVGLLGKATQILNHGGYVARNVRAASGFASAWKIGFFDNRLDSDSLGKKEALISLNRDGTIDCDNPDHPGAKAVLADYERRVDGTLIASADLLLRIEACLVNHYGARSTDMGLYVSPWNAARALDLVVELRPIAGRRIRAWSHTDRESISEALCDSFVTDLAKLERDIEAKEIVGATLLTRCERLRVEAEGLAAILGSDAVTGYLARVRACDSAVTVGLSETVQRAMNLELS